ncbi:MAG TPA: GlsB/YeaQ/YmgE family stress response membrane protein [Chloroflexota bacterium]|nr:GlsB/YeaQ/YmgE family stress response membrane protein [Chloroflexota bacterium]
MALFLGLIVICILLLLWFGVAVTALAIHLIPWIIIGLIAGWVASAVVGSRHGILGDIGLGLLGAILGGFIFRVVLHQSGTGFIKDTLVAIVGAIIVLLIGKLISPRHSAAY